MQDEPALLTDVICAGGLVAWGKDGGRGEHSKGLVRFRIICIGTKMRLIFLPPSLEEKGPGKAERFNLVQYWMKSM